MFTPQSPNIFSIKIIAFFSLTPSFNNCFSSDEFLVIISMERNKTRQEYYYLLSWSVADELFVLGSASVVWSRVVK